MLAADNAKFGSPFAKIGAVLDSGAHKAFVERLGPAVALDLIYSGRFLSGAEAAAAGLVSRVVPADELAEVAESTPALSPRVRRWRSPSPSGWCGRSATRGCSLAEVLDLEAAAQSRSSHTA